MSTVTAASSDAYLDQLIKADEARLLCKNRFSELTTEERRQLLYKPAFSRSCAPRTVAPRPMPSNLRHLSQYEQDGFRCEEDVEDQLVREYELVKAAERIRRTATETGSRGHSNAHSGDMSPAKLEWLQLNEAESYRRDLYQSTLLHPHRARHAPRSSADQASEMAACATADRTRTISNSRVVGPYLTLHSVGRYTRYEALQQRHPIHHGGNTPKSVTQPTHGASPQK